MSTRMILAALMAVVGASLLVSAAFAGPTASKASQAGGTLRVNHNTSDYQYVDPQKCYDTGCAELLWPTSLNIYQYPETNGAAGTRAYLEAASSVAVSKDGKTYTFTIRKGQKASNGKTVTPQWFVRAFERALSPKMGDAAAARAGADSIVGQIVVGADAFYNGKASKITGLTVKGDQLIIKLTKPAPYLVNVLAMNWFSATDPATPYNEQDFSGSWVTAGPYYIASHDIGRSVVLQRNKYYTGKRPHNADQIVVTVGGDENQSLLQVKSGQADLDSVPPAAAAAQLGDQYGVNKTQFWVKPTVVTTWWALNTLPGTPFASLKLRKAVNWAIDRPAQVRVSGKYGGRRTDQILPPSMPGFIENNSLYAYKGANPTVAKKVAGDVSNVPAIRVLGRNSAAGVNLNQLMAYELQQMGLKVKTENVPTSQLFSRAGNPKSGGYDMARLGWQADYPDPSNFINVLFNGADVPTTDAGSNNWSYFNNPTFNAAMAKAALLSGDARYKAYGNIDIQMMKQAAPVAPLLNNNNRIIVSSRISNFTYNDANTYVAWNALVIK
jgi:ABC-type oligopeptide transport system substrate-binding subunit